jgi:hypothetical protein
VKYSSSGLALGPHFRKREKLGFENPIRRARFTSPSFDHHHHNSPPTTTVNNTDTMGGVSVRDVPSDKFIAAYAAFLKRQGKLPIPGP